MAEKEIVLHTRLRFKPEGSDQYVVALVETTASDVLVETPFSDIYDGKGTLKDLLDAIDKHMAKKALAMTYQELMDLNPVLEAGQIAFETDTGIFRIGNGVAPYSNLTFAIKTELQETQNLSLMGLNVVNENNEVVDIVNDDASVGQVTVNSATADGIPIQINGSSMNIGTDNSHNSDIWFEIKDPIN